MKKWGKYKFILSIFPVLFLLTSCSTDELGNSLSDSIEAKLIPNIWAFLVQLFAFIILIIVVTKFAYKPVRKYLDKRSELLNSEKKETESLNQKAKENILESEKKLAEVRDNASKIIDDAREKAKLEKENILKEANQEANKVKTNAYKAIEEEKSKAKQEIKEDINVISTAKLFMNVFYGQSYLDALNSGLNTTELKLQFQNIYSLLKNQ